MLLLFVLSGLIVKVMLRTGRKPSEAVRQSYKLTDYLIFPTLTHIDLVLQHGKSGSCLHLSTLIQGVWLRMWPRPPPYTPSRRKKNHLDLLGELEEL